MVLPGVGKPDLSDPIESRRLGVSTCASPVQSVQGHSAGWRPLLSSMKVPVMSSKSPESVPVLFPHKEHVHNAPKDLVLARLAVQVPKDILVSEIYVIY